MRWKALVPTVVLVALVGAFFSFFFDGMVERAIEKHGTEANGAKVELGDLDISFLKLRVVARGLQVADAGAPMTNALEIDRLEFDLEGKPLTWKKVIVREASITGVKTGTPRKTSGAVKLAPKPADEPAKDDAAPGKAAEAASFAMANLKEQYDPKKTVRVDELASYKKIKAEQERLPAAFDALEARVNGLDGDPAVENVRAFIEKVKTEKLSGAEGLKRAKELLEEGKKVKADLEAAKGRIAELKSGVTNEINAARNSLKEIDELRRQDVENALSGLKAGFSGEGLTRGVIGDKWFGKIDTALGWFNKVRALVPQKKSAEEKPEPPPRTGKDVHFPFRYNWPAFHLKTAAVSGATSGESPIEYAGTLKDVTSDPKIVGRPITLELSGKGAGGRALALRGEADYTGDVAREALKLKYTGLPLAGVSLGNVGGPVAVTDGLGTLSVNLEARAEALSGRIDFNAAPVALAHSLDDASRGNRLLQLVNQVVTQLKELNVGVVVSDTIKSPDFKVTTNIDNALEGAVRQVLAKELDEIKAQYRARVAELVDGEKAKLTQLVDSKSGGLAGKFQNKEQAVQSAQGQLDKALDDAKKKATESLPIPLPGAQKQEGQPQGEPQKPAVPDLKGIFKKR